MIMDNYEITLQTLKELKERLTDTRSLPSTGAVVDRDGLRALEKVIRMVECARRSSAVNRGDKITVRKQELDDLIPLAAWAHKHGLDESYARQKARRGRLSSARKIGRDWFVSASEPNLDNRKKLGNSGCSSEE